MAKGTEPRITVDKDGMLLIAIPLRVAVKEAEESESGKSMLLCSARTRLETKEGGMVEIGLNVMTKNPKYAAFLAEKKPTGRDPEYDKWLAAKRAGTA